eukprot:gene11849-14954_t
MLLKNPNLPAAAKSNASAYKALPDHHVPLSVQGKDLDQGTPLGHPPRAPCQLAARSRKHRNQQTAPGLNYWCTVQLWNSLDVEQGQARGFSGTTDGRGKSKLPCRDLTDGQNGGPRCVGQTEFPELPSMASIGCGLLACLLVAAILMPSRVEEDISFITRKLDRRVNTADHGNKHRILMFYTDEALTAMELLPDHLKLSTQATLLRSGMQVVEFENSDIYLEAAPYLEHEGQLLEEVEKWHLPRVGADYAWSITRGAPEVVVAIVDSDLKHSLWVNHGEIPGNGIDDDGNGFIDDIHGYDFGGACAPPVPGNPFRQGCWECVGDGHPQDESKDSHGTHVAGIIAAMQDNLLGVSGAAPNIKLMVLKSATLPSWYPRNLLGVSGAAPNMKLVVLKHPTQYPLLQALLVSSMGAHIVSASIGRYSFQPLLLLSSMGAETATSFLISTPPRSTSTPQVVDCKGDLWASNIAAAYSAAPTQLHQPHLHIATPQAETPTNFLISTPPPYMSTVLSHRPSHTSTPQDVD